MLTFRVGSLSKVGLGHAMATYLSVESLRPERDNLASYYTGEQIPQPSTYYDSVGTRVFRGEISYSEAVQEMLGKVLDRLPEGNIDYDALIELIGDRIAEAATRADFAETIAQRGGTTAELRPDMNPEIAQRLGIDRSRPITVTEIGNLMALRRADGAPIEGKKIDRPMKSVAEVFGLLPKVLDRLPTADEVDRILTGDQSAAGSRANPRARFLAAYGVPSTREPAPEEIANIRAGRMANGELARAHPVLKTLTATKSPTAYIDLVWSADKSVSVAWALADTEAERVIIQTAHRNAVADAMRYFEQTIGFTKVNGGRQGIEPAQLAWVSFHHYTSRPVAGIARTPTTTEFHEFSPAVPDPQLHSHVVVLNTAKAADGRLGSVYLDQLEGRVKELGHVYQAYLARGLRAHGIDVAQDPATGSARIMSIPSDIRRAFSLRSRQIEARARELAPDFDALTPEQQIGLLRRSVLQTRRLKADRDRPSDFIAWRRLAKEMGYQHATVLRPDAVRAERNTPERHRIAYEATLPIIEQAFSRRAKFAGQEIREFAARGLVAGGIAEPAADIAAITRAYRERGVRQAGKLVPLIWGKDVPVRGKPRWSVTTGLHESEEQKVVDLARSFAQDRSARLPSRTVERAARAFLSRHPEINPAEPQWRAQRAVIDQLAAGGRLALTFGPAGVGKTTLLSPLIDAYKADGRTVYGTAVAWRHAGLLADAGIDAKHRASIDAFLLRAEKGRYPLDKRSVVVIEELSLVGRRHMLELLQLQQKHGFQMIAVGDPKQGQSVEAPVIDILQRAIGRDAIPAIVTTIRQKTDREREIAGLFRDGKAEQAIAMKRADGTARLVAGGPEATIRAVAETWRERMLARGREDKFSLTVSAPTNDDVRAIGLAIRREARAIGKIGDDIFSVMAGARTHPTAMPLAVGEQVRLFDRIAGFASNGDVVEVRAAGPLSVLVRNVAGEQRDIPWSKLRERPDAPVRLAYGYALTIDAIQGATSSEHIDALPSGSQVSQGLKGYVAESRHRETTWMIVSDAAERLQMGARIPMGEAERRAAITEDDVWANVGRNLSQQPIKADALSFIARATDLRRGTVGDLLRSEVPIERRERSGISWADVTRYRELLEAGRHPLLGRVLEIARDARERVIERFHRGRDQGYER